MPGLTAAAVVASLALVPVASTPTAAAAPAPARPAAGELPERRTATSATRRNADGSLTTTLYAAPVHYRTAAGGWERIDRRLVDAGPGAGPDADGYRWRTAAHAFDARFADRAGADFVQLTLDGARFRLSAQDAAGGEGRVAGSAVSYPDAFGQATLTYAVAATGLKSLITLTGPDDPTSFTFRLAGPATGPAPVVRSRTDGSHAVFLAPRTDPVFVLDAPSAAEAGDGRQARPADPAAKPRLEVSQDGRDLVLLLSIDAGWLRAPDRRFPVELDPTFTLQPDAEDTYFGMPNYLVNTADNMFVGTTDTAWRTAVRFDLAGLPSGSPISDAKLGLYNAMCLAVDGAPYCGGVPHTIDAHRLTAAWSLSSSAGQFTFDGTAAGSTTLPASPPPGWVSWGITSTVQGWLTGTTPNYGVLLKRRTEELNQSGPMFWGRRYTGNGDLLPKLDVTVVNDAVDMAVPATVHGNGAELSWTRWAGTAAFQRYEVHRSSARIFTPSQDTLLTTISDPAVTTYRDTTASGGKEFTYRVVANDDASPPRTVTLPPDGQARTLIQPDPPAGQTTYLYYYTGYANCANYGADDVAYTGTSATARQRTVVRFDLRSIPPKAPIVSARASMWEKWGPQGTATVEAHRITRAWKEGTGHTTCGADGATWYETQSGQNWTTQGGDYDGAIAASVIVAPGYSPEFHPFDPALWSRPGSTARRRTTACCSS